MHQSLSTCPASRVAVLVAMAIAATFVAAGCRSTPGATAGAPSGDVWAVVEDRNITREFVETAYRRIANASETPSEEEALTAKLALLNDIIVQEILLAKARELKIELPESELDNAYAEARKNMPDEEFQKELTRRKLTAADMRDGLRRELIVQKVIDREVTSKVTPSDQEITDFFNANRAQFDLKEDSYHIAQIVVTPVRDAQVSNRTRDDASTPQEANAKTRMLMERLKGGASFQELAMDYSEHPDSAQRGGDLGFVPISAIQNAPPPMRDAVLKSSPGSAQVVTLNGAHTIVLVVAQQSAGQRDLSTPGVRENITASLRDRKEKLLRAAYLTAVRSDAKVTNYLARRLVESQGKMPTLAPSAPGNK
jgi:peptidyl-prolyl cis-trans isomerase SurA